MDRRMGGGPRHCGPPPSSGQASDETADVPSGISSHSWIQASFRQPVVDVETVDVPQVLGWIRWLRH